VAGTAAEWFKAPVLKMRGGTYFTSRGISNYLDLGLHHCSPCWAVSPDPRLFRRVWVQDWVQALRQCEAVGDYRGDHRSGVSGSPSSHLAVRDTDACVFQVTAPPLDKNQVSC
jgi:hypothetical protein